jgi:hypothetical protein
MGCLPNSFSAPSPGELPFDTSLLGTWPCECLASPGEHECGESLLRRSVRSFKVGLRFLRGPRSLLASLHVIYHAYSAVGFARWRHWICMMLELYC